MAEPTRQHYQLATGKIKGQVKVPTSQTPSKKSK